MKKLDDIPKKEVFNVPDGYFDKLPSVIQSRIAEKSTKREFVPSFQAAWRYALPVIILLAVSIFWFNKTDESTAESLLASVHTDDLVAYLNESDISVEEVMNAAEFNTEDLNDIEGEVYNLDLDKLDLKNYDVDEFDLENLENEID